MQQSWSLAGVMPSPHAISGTPHTHPHTNTMRTHAPGLLPLLSRCFSSLTQDAAVQEQVAALGKEQAPGSL